MATYLDVSLPPPVQCDWSVQVTRWPIMLNDSIGDCTCAAAGHMIQQWSSYASTPCVPTDQQVLAAYEAISGYVPGDDSTDIGANMLDVLKYWKREGIAGHRISAFVALDLKNTHDAKDAIYLFGNVYAGFNLPASARDQKEWSVPSFGPVGDGEPGTWGGHTVPVVAYDQAGLTCISWGGAVRLTWEFYLTYADEAYAVLSHDWIGRNGLTPARFSLENLQADLRLLA